MPRKPKTQLRPGREESAPIPEADAPKRPRTVHSHADHHLHRELNWKVLVITLVIILVATPSAYFLHGYQVNQLVGTFLTRADELAAPEEGEPDLMAAARHVQNYLRLRPDDVEQRIRLANLFGQIADDDPQYTSMAARMYRQAIAALNQSEEDAETREPKIIELRRKTVPLLLAMGQFKPAEIEVLRQPRGEPDEQGRRVLINAEDRRLFAMAILGRVQIGAIRGPFELDGEDAEWTVGDVLRQALELSPGDPELTFAFAQITRRQSDLLSDERSDWSEPKRVEESERLIADMAANASDKSPQEQAEIYLTAYRYRERYRNKTDFPVEEEVRVPGESDEERQEREALAEAKKQDLVDQAAQQRNEYLDRALELATDETNTTIEPALRANILMAAAGREQQVAESLQSEKGNEADAVNDQVAAHWQQAEQYIRRAMDANPTDERPYLELGSLLIEQNQLEPAIEEMQTGLKEINSPGFLLQLAIAEATLRLKQDPNPALDELEGSAAFARLKPVARDDLRQGILVLRGQWQLAKDPPNPSQAVPPLRTAVALSASNTQTSRQLRAAYELLAQAYQRLEMWDLAAESWEQLSRRVTGRAKSPYQLSAANAWRRAGQPGRAVPFYRDVLSTYQGVLSNQSLPSEQKESIRQALARVLQMAAETTLADQLSRPVSSRDWTQFTSAFARLEPFSQQLNEPWAPSILYGRYAIGRSALAAKQSGKSQEQVAAEQAAAEQARSDAVNRLEAVEEQFQDSADLVKNLALLYPRLGEEDRGNAAFERFKDLAANETEVALVAAQRLINQDQYDEGRQVLAAQLAKTDLPADQAEQLRVALKQIAGGSTSDQTETAEDVDPAEISNPRQLMQLANMALGRNDLEQAKKFEDRLGELEGQASVRYKFLMARRLLAKLTIDQIKPSDPSYDQTMRQVAQLQQEIQTDRPEWPDGYLLKTIQADAAGDYDTAIGALQRAIELGRRDPQVYEQLARLMWKAGKTGPEFDQVLAELGSRVSRLSDLSGLSIQRALRSGDMEDALTRAQSGVEARPDDPLAHIQLGGVLLAKGDTSAAQQEYEKATEVAPTDLRTWNALFGFYRQTEQPELARKIIKTIADEQINMQTSDGTRRPLLEAEKQLAIARLEYELGDTEPAKERLSRAVDLAKGDKQTQVAILYQAAKYDLAEEKADAAIDKLVAAQQIAPDNNEVRRTLAGAYAARGRSSENSDDFAKALELLPDVKSDDIQQLMDRRLRAILYAKQTDGDYRQNVANAVAIYEDLVRQEPVQPGDRLQLANLYAIQSQIEATYQGEQVLVQGQGDAADAARKASDERARCLQNAREQFVSLVSTDQPDYRHVEQFIRFLAFNGFHDETEDWLGTLRKTVIGDESDDLNRLATYLRILIQYDCRAGAERALDELEVRMKEQSRSGDLSDDMRRQFVGFCINLGKAELAEPWLNEFIQNNASNMLALALKAEWMHAMHQDTELDELVEPAAKSALEQLTDDRQRASLCYTVGRIYTATEMYSDALPWHERLFDLAPEGYAPLAVNLARLGRTSEMLRVCEKAIPSIGLDKVAAKLAEALSGVPRLSEMSLHAGDDLVDQALRAHPKDQPLLMTSAALRARQQEIEEAAELYERVLDQDPRNIIALNNQATLLAEMPGTGDHLSKAIQRIDKAILYEGVQAGLLDTRGVTLIMRAQREPGKAAFWYAEAVAVLRQACWSDKADARHRLHWAIALEGANDKAKSEEQFQTALDNGVEDLLLTPDDLRQLARLKKTMNITAASRPDSAAGPRQAAGESTQPATMR